MPSFNSLSHCPARCDEHQAPLFFEIRANLQRKSDCHGAGAREPLEPTAVSLSSKDEDLRAWRHEDQIVSKIHLNLLALPLAIKGAGQELFIRRVLRGKENLQGTSVSQAVTGAQL